MPNTRPTVAATPKERAMDAMLIMVGMPAKVDTAYARRTPMITPMIPPDTLIMIASNRNCCITSDFLQGVR